MVYDGGCYGDVVRDGVQILTPGSRLRRVEIKDPSQAYSIDTLKVNDTEMGKVE